MAPQEAVLILNQAVTNDIPNCFDLDIDNNEETHRVKWYAYGYYSEIAVLNDKENDDVDIEVYSD
jgi:hypothetical protein